VTVASGAVFLLAGPGIYGLLGGRGPILAAALEYSNVIFAGALAYWLLGTLTSVVRATGQVAILAYVYVGAEILHIALVPALVANTVLAHRPMLRPPRGGRIPPSRRLALKV